MTRRQYLYRLALALKTLPQAQIDQTLEQFSNAIAQRMRMGLSEEKAVASMEPIEQVAARMGVKPEEKHEEAREEHQPRYTAPSYDTRATRPESVSRKHHHGFWYILLLAVTFPVWFSVLMTVFGVLFAVVVAVAAVALGCTFGLAIGGICYAVQGVVQVMNYGLSGLTQIGMGLVALGIGIFAGYLAKNYLPGILRALRSIVRTVYDKVRRLFA